MQINNSEEEKKKMRDVCSADGIIIIVASISKIFLISYLDFLSFFGCKIYFVERHSSVPTQIYSIKYSVTIECADGKTKTCLLPLSTRFLFSSFKNTHTTSNNKKSPKGIFVKAGVKTRSGLIHRVKDEGI
jgi:hypothetical protein